MFVLRCRETGDAVLIDAANEHEKLLELCRRLGVRRVLETHGHHDHIGAVPQMREAGYEVAVTSQDAPMLKDVGYDVFLDDAEVIEVGRLRLHAIHNPGHTPGSISFKIEGAPVLFSGDTLFPGGPGSDEVPRQRLRDDHRIDRPQAVHPARRHRGDARARRRHDDRHRATPPRRVGRAWLVRRRSSARPRSVARGSTSRTLEDFLARRPAGLDLVRLVLAVLVLVSHTWTLGGFGGEPHSPLGSDFLTLGGFAVAGFFALSGLLVGRSAMRRTMPAFARSRAVRVLPAYWVALVVSAFGVRAARLAPRARTASAGSSRPIPADP